MKSITFTVKGVQGKARPRASYIHGHAVMYTPKKTKDYEKQIAKAYLDEGGTMFDKDCPVKVSVLIFHGVPKSASKKKRLEMLDQMSRPMKKSDIDNCLKIVADGLQGVAYHDDVQIVEIDARKFWSAEDYLIVTVSDASL